MTKTDEVLLELSRTANDFIQSIGPFQYKDKMYNLIDNFAASKPMECGVCGNYPIYDVSIIRSEKGNRLNVGNECIDRIANHNISDWFKIYRKKRRNILDNRQYIDGLSTIRITSIDDFFLTTFVYIRGSRSVAPWKWIEVQCNVTWRHGRKVHVPTENWPI